MSRAAALDIIFYFFKCSETDLVHAISFKTFLLLIVHGPITLTFFILVRNFFTKKFSKKKNDKIKTVCVGNIYIGGTGKTPLSIKINNLLKIQGLRSTIIKKFYSDQSDEQNLIKNYTNLICKKNGQRN